MQAGAWVVTWAFMCLAMMVPTAIRPAVRLSDGRPRRWLAFLSAYAVIWMGTAVLAYPVDRLVPWNGATILLGWVLVGGYGMLPSTAKHLRSCRQLATTAKPWRTGTQYAIRCATACLPLMILSMATIHAAGLSWPLMLGAMCTLSACIMWAKHPGTPRAYVRGASAAVTALAVLAFSLGLSPIPGDAPAGHGHFGQAEPGTR